MLTLHILSLFIYTYLMCLVYLCKSDVSHDIKNKELDYDNRAISYHKIHLLMTSNYDITSISEIF